MFDFAYITLIIYKRQIGYFSFFNCEGTYYIYVDSQGRYMVESYPIGSECSYSHQIPKLSATSPTTLKIGPSWYNILPILGTPVGETAMYVTYKITKYTSPVNQT